MNEILIRGLRVQVFIGVPDAERAVPQELIVDVTIDPMVRFGDLHDDISRTVDYAAAAARVSDVARERPRRLIETLADEIARMLLEEFPARSALVEIRKFVLPETDYVSVRCRIERDGVD